MGYIKLKGKIKSPDCKKTSESNAESIGSVYLFSSAIKIQNCGQKITMKQMLHLSRSKNYYLVTYTGIIRNGNTTFKQARGQRIIGSLGKILQSEEGLLSSNHLVPIDYKTIYRCQCSRHLEVSARRLVHSLWLCTSLLGPWCKPRMFASLAGADICKPSELPS